MTPGGSYTRLLWWSLAPLGAFAALVLTLNQYPLPWRLELPWVASLGVGLNFHIDALSAQFLVLITGIGALVFVYASAYMANVAGVNRLFALLLLFMGAMIGAVCADHLLVLFLFWELTSLTSFFLVGFKYSDDSTRSAARMALFITMGGGLALLAAFILLAQISGTWSLHEIVASRDVLREDSRLPAALTLLFIGCFSKSAQFPLHFWLPNAMTAPTPVSAYLHSATMVKLGIYLLARLDPAFNDLLLWQSVLLIIGSTTAVWAAISALWETDLKRVLARSTISALGTLTVLIGISNPQASLAVIAFLFAHALYKAPLFFIAGNIDHATGTRHIEHLAGLRRRMPWTAAAAVMAGLSMAGLPLSFGFIAKGVMTAAKGGTDVFAVVGYVLLIVNAVAVAVAAVAAIRLFWGPLSPSFEKVREAPWPMLLPPLLIALFGLEFEIVPNVADPLLVDAARAISAGEAEDVLRVSPDFGRRLTATEITVGVGLLLFLFWKRLHHWLRRWPNPDAVGPEAAFHACLRGLPRLAAWQTRALQHGNLSGYLRVMLLAVLLLTVAAWLAVESDLRMLASAPPHAARLGVAAVLILAGALAAPFLRDRMALLMTIGLIGYGSAVLFLFAGAPDLAFTQFMVETALVIIASAVLAHYGPPSRSPEPWLRNAVVAVAAGLVTLALLIALFSLPRDATLAEWYAAQALPAAKGRNVVNVILVDFRALDTLGEISVVMFSALAAWPMLRALRTGRYVPSARVVMLERGAILAYWIMLGAAAWVLLRGHNAPGGGFIAGLMAFTASALLAIVYGQREARRRLPLAPLSLALAGVLLALASGVPGMLVGSPFLTHLWWQLELGGLSLKLSTVLLFDVGVFCAVWGALGAYLLGLLDHEAAL